MSTQYPEGPPSGPPQAPPPPPQYPAQPYGDPNQPYPGFDLQRPGTNVMAILGLIFAFVFSPLGIVFSAIGLSQIKKRREGGKGLAIAGLVLSIVFLVISVAALALLTLGLIAASTGSSSGTAAAAPRVRSAPVQRAVDPVTADAHGIVRACTVIIPALTKSDTTLPAASTSEEYVQLVTMLRTTIETAAHTSTDPVFVQDVLTLSQDIKQALELTESQDNTAIEKTFTDDLQAVHDDCRAAGYVE